MEAILFYLFAVLVVASAVAVVLLRNPVHSAISLIFSFFVMAGIFLLLNAQLMAVIQILVYAGAIMVLFLFVILLLNLQDEELGDRRITFFKVLGLAAVTAAAALLIKLLLGAGKVPVAEVTSFSADDLAKLGTIKNVASSLYSEYLLPFEVCSVLLLTAMVGAVVLAKRKLR